MFSQQDVHDALYATTIRALLGSGQWSRVEQALAADAAGWPGATGTASVLAALRASYDRGCAVLAQAAIWRTSGSASPAAVEAAAPPEAISPLVVETQQ